MRCDALRVTPSRLSRVTDASESARDSGSESAATKYTWRCKAAVPSSCDHGDGGRRGRRYQQSFLCECPLTRTGSCDAMCKAGRVAAVAALALKLLLRVRTVTGTVTSNLNSGSDDRLGPGRHGTMPPTNLRYHKGSARRRRRRPGLGRHGCCASVQNR